MTTLQVILSNSISLNSTAWKIEITFIETSQGKQIRHWKEVCHDKFKHFSAAMYFLWLLSMIGAVACQQDFGYAGLTDGQAPGPANWSSIYPLCAGKLQSPINIVTSKVKKKSYLPLKINFDNPCGLVAGQLANSIHAPTFNVDSSKGTATLSGGPLKRDEYKLQQFHFHFGCENSRGSEHTINDEHYAAQLHLVFYNKKYKSFSNSVDKPDGLAVLGILISATCPGNRILGNFAKKLLKVTEEGAIANVTEADGIRLKYLMPYNNKQDDEEDDDDDENDVDDNDDDGSGDEDDKAKKIGYYTYQGSLTTPPCYESVRWIVFKDMIKISNKQASYMYKHH
ncbi:hypothetical protein ACROYT_G040178 [Oculina patagonica]